METHYPARLWQLASHCKAIEDAVESISGFTPGMALSLLTYAAEALRKDAITDAADMVKIHQAIQKQSTRDPADEYAYFVAKIGDIWDSVVSAARGFVKRMAGSKDTAIRSVLEHPVYYWKRSTTSEGWQKFLGLQQNNKKRTRPSLSKMLALFDKCFSPVVFWHWNLNVLYRGETSPLMGNNREPAAEFAKFVKQAKRNELLELAVLAKFVMEAATPVTSVVDENRPSPAALQQLMQNTGELGAGVIGLDQIAVLGPAEQILLFGHELVQWHQAEEPPAAFLDGAFAACPAAVHLHGLFWTPLMRKYRQLKPDAEIPFELRHKMTPDLVPGERPGVLSRALHNAVTIAPALAANMLLTSDPSGLTQVRNAERRVNFSPFVKMSIAARPRDVDADSDQEEREEDSMEVEYAVQDPDQILGSSTNMSSFAPLTAFRLDAPEPAAQLQMWNGDQITASEGFLRDGEYHLKAKETMAEILRWLTAANECVNHAFALSDIATGTFFPGAAARAMDLKGLNRDQLCRLHARLTLELAAASRAMTSLSPFSFCQAVHALVADTLESSAPLQAERLAQMTRDAGSRLIQRHRQLTPPKGMRNNPAWLLSTTVRDVIGAVCTGDFIDMEPTDIATAFTWVLLYAHAFFFFCCFLPIVHKSLNEKAELTAQRRDLQLLLVAARDALSHKSQYCTINRFAVEARITFLDNQERRAAAGRTVIAHQMEQEDDGDREGDQEQEQDEGDQEGGAEDSMQE